MQKYPRSAAVRIDFSLTSILRSSDDPHGRRRFVFFDDGSRRDGRVRADDGVRTDRHARDQQLVVCKVMRADADSGPDENVVADINQSTLDDPRIRRPVDETPDV